MVRFIHISDVHLDTSFSACGFPARLGDRKRGAIRATFRRILADARLHNVDLVLIAGDLFEHDRITPDTVEFLKQQFEAAQTPVFIAPGNHDPFLRGSPYCQESWPENVHIFCEEQFRSVELPDVGVRVTGFGFNRAHLEEHLFMKLRPLPKDGLNLVVSHASDMGSVPTGKSRHGPFTIDEIAGKNVNYCALGHYHQQRPVLNPIDETQVWYSGIPEGRGWDEEGAGGYLLAEVESGRVQVTACSSHQYPFRTLCIECEGFSSRDQILDAVLQHRGSVFDSNTMLRIRLVGAIDSRLDLSIEELAERLSSEALHIQWLDETQPAVDFDSIAQERTLRGRFVRILTERIAAAEGEQRHVLEKARFYGFQALLGRDVRIR